MKRTCDGCKAFNDSFNRCDLGYKIEPCKHVWFIPVKFRPLEECPKPKTYKELVSGK